MKITWGIAYTDNGSPPGPGNSIINWRSSEESFGLPIVFFDVGEALKECENDGWRGYVCSYPDGKFRPTDV